MVFPLELPGRLIMGLVGSSKAGEVSLDVAANTSHDGALN